MIQSLYLECCPKGHGVLPFTNTTMDPMGSRDSNSSSLAICTTSSDTNTISSRSNGGGAWANPGGSMVCGSLASGHMTCTRAAGPGIGLQGGWPEKHLW